MAKRMTKGYRPKRTANRVKRSLRKSPFRLRGYKTKKGNQNPFPSTYTTKMKYADSYTLTNTSPLQVFNLNGLFDPDQSGLGHQPLGFDQLCPTMYSRYRVSRISWTVIAAPPNTSGTCAMIACRPNNASLPAAPNVGNWAEKPRTQVRTMAVGGDPMVITGSVNLAELNGKSFAQYISDDNTAGSSSANPTEIQQLGVQAFDQDGTTLTAFSTKIQVILEYTVTFFDPVIPAQS